MMIILALLIGMASGDTLNFTVEEAIDFALQNNPEIEQLEIEYQKSKEQVGQAISSFYPEISASGYYAYITEVPIIEFQETQSFTAITRILLYAHQAILPSIIIPSQMADCMFSHNQIIL